MSVLTEPTTEDAFSLMAKSTQLPLTEYTKVTRAQFEIESCLQQAQTLASTVLYGAFARKTIVSPLAGSIVDMLVVYRERDVRRSYPNRLIQQLLQQLQPVFPQCRHNDRNAFLYLPFDGFLFKIHPAWAREDNNYMLPHPVYNEWTRYDIHIYSDTFDRENLRHKGRLIDLIRLIKTWNRGNGNFFNGYYLELLVTEILQDHAIQSHARALCHFFRKAVALVVFQKHDPANVELIVEGLNNIDTLIQAMTQLRHAYEQASQAQQYEEEGDMASALQCWREIFGASFPGRMDLLVHKARQSGLTGAEVLRQIMALEQQ